MENNDLKTSLLVKILEAEQAAYQRGNEVWRGLETKAQGNTAIAGIFIAVIFSYIKDFREKAISISCFEKFALTVSLGLFLISVWLSAIALLVRNTATPDRELNDMRNLRDSEEQLLGERLVAIYGDRIRAWEEANKEQDINILNKGNKLSKAQISTLIGVCAIAIVALYHLFFKEP